MTTTINASPSNGLVQTADGSGILKVQSNGVTTNALAWVNFNGTTSPGTIRASYNVGSVTKNGTGLYTVNFTNALADANYAAVGMIRADTDYAPTVGQPYNYSSQSTTTLNLKTGSFNSVQDSTVVSIAVFGN